MSDLADNLSMMRKQKALMGHKSRQIIVSVVPEKICCLEDPVGLEHIVGVDNAAACGWDKPLLAQTVAGTRLAQQCSPTTST